MRVISVIEDTKVIKKILDHLKLPSDVPARHPARAPPQIGFFDECFDESFRSPILLLLQKTSKRPWRRLCLVTLRVDLPRFGGHRQRK